MNTASLAIAASALMVTLTVTQAPTPAAIADAIADAAGAWLPCLSLALA